MTLIVLTALGLILFDMFTRPRDSTTKTLDLTPLVRKRKR